MISRKLSLSLIAFGTLGCSDHPSQTPTPVIQEKKQMVVFDVESVTCTGLMLCDQLVKKAEKACLEISPTLRTAMGAGWQVKVSTKKSHVAFQQGDVKILCNGTEYIMEK